MPVNGAEKRKILSYPLWHVLHSAVPVNLITIPLRTFIYAAQESSFYSGANSAAAGGANGHGFVHGASPHGGLPRLFQRVLADMKEFIGTKNDVLVLACVGHGRDGSVSLEPHLARR
jgi:hypothetical protein